MMSYLWILLLGSLLAGSAKAQDGEVDPAEDTPVVPEEGGNSEEETTEEPTEVTEEPAGDEGTEETEDAPGGDAPENVFPTAGEPEATTAAEYEDDEVTTPAPENVNPADGDGGEVTTTAPEGEEEEEEEEAEGTTLAPEQDAGADEGTEVTTPAPEVVEPADGGAEATTTAPEEEEVTTVAPGDPAPAEATTTAAEVQEPVVTTVAPAAGGAGGGEEPAATTPAAGGAGGGEEPAATEAAPAVDPVDEAPKESTTKSEPAGEVEPTVAPVTPKAPEVEGKIKESIGGKSFANFGVSGALPPQSTDSPQQSESRSDGTEGAPKAKEGSGSLAAILCSVVAAAVGAVTGYFTYVKKKLCFQNRQEADPEAARKADAAAEAQSDPQVLSNLLTSS